MSATPPEDQRAPIREQQRKRSRRGGRRGVRARALAEIQAKARERQNAWAEKDQPDLTAALTGKLSSLFIERRVERNEEAPGDDFRGRTQAAGR